MRKEKVTVTIITATYNYGEFIRDALGSVNAQTFRDWECIVIDDASTDGTADIVQEFVQRDDRFKYLLMDKNGGVSAARNKGLEQARGRYIQLLDADDVLAPQKLKRHVAYMEQHPEVSLVYSDFVHFIGSPDLNKEGEYATSEKINGSGNKVIARLLKGNIFRPATVMFRASVLATVGLFNERFRYVEDLDLWFRIAAEGNEFRFLNDPSCISGVRVNHRGLSKDVPRMRSSYLPVLQSLWNTEGVSVLNRLQLIARYVDAALEAILVKRYGITVLPGGSFLFLMIIFPLAIIVLPIWLLSRPFRSL